jgi:hypothetical protein
MARGKRSGRRAGGQSIVSGMLAGSNGDLVSQSGGRATSFQSTNGSKKNKYGPGSTGGKSTGTGGWIPGRTYAIYGSQGDSAEMRSGRTKTPQATIKTTGNTGATNASIVMPKALGPKGFGGQYRLSKGY